MMITNGQAAIAIAAASDEAEAEKQSEKKNEKRDFMSRKRAYEHFIRTTSLI